MPVPVTNLLQSAVEAFASLPPFAGRLRPAQLLAVGSRGRAGPSGRRAACHFTRFLETGERFSLDGRWELPRIFFHGTEIRYIISFVFPRFLFLEPLEQAEDVIHELLHVDLSFSGTPSPLRHGAAFDARVGAIAREAARRGIAVPHLAKDGDTVFYRRFRPFPHPYRRAHPRARRVFSENDLELAALVLDPRDRQAPPPRYLYECPACGEQYRRQRVFRMASCGSCANRYDARFKLRLVAGRSGLRARMGHHGFRPGR